MDYVPNVVKPPGTLTCWYWNTPGRECNKSDEECDYIHGRTAAGVALKPGAGLWPGKMEMDPWGVQVEVDRWGVQVDGGFEASAEAAPEAVESWGGNNPAHVETVEERVLREAVGW